MLHIKEAIIVEGKFDKERLKSITDAPIVCTHGFMLYRDKRIVNSIRKFAESIGVIILTDSDQAGFRIRSYLKQCIGEKGIIRHAYIPSIKGKERRKDNPGKEGILGVEGMEEEILVDILSKVTEVSVNCQKNSPKLTKQHFYDDGLTGHSDSAERRKDLAKILNLPPRISANAMIELINTVYGYEKYRESVDKLDKNNSRLN